MTKRKIEDIEAFEKDDQTVPAEAKTVLVSVNYPTPTALNAIVKDVSEWSGECFAMEPSTNKKIQIFANKQLPPSEAYDLFIASLSVVGLRAVRVGPVIKIVPLSHATVA